MYIYNTSLLAYIVRAHLFLSGMRWMLRLHQIGMFMGVFVYLYIPTCGYDVVLVRFENYRARELCNAHPLVY